MRVYAFVLVLAAVLCCASASKDKLNAEVLLSCVFDEQLSNSHKGANAVSNNGTINVWIHAHTHNDPGWLVTADQYYVKVVILTYAVFIHQQVRYILDTVIGTLAINPHRKFTYGIL